MGVGQGHKPPHSARLAIVYTPGMAAHFFLLTTRVSTVPIGVSSRIVTCRLPFTGGSTILAQSNGRYGGKPAEHHAPSPVLSSHQPSASPYCFEQHQQKSANAATTCCSGIVAKHASFPSQRDAPEKNILTISCTHECAAAMRASLSFPSRLSANSFLIISDATKPVSSSQFPECCEPAGSSSKIEKSTDI